jgi:hypothetical protein
MAIEHEDAAQPLDLGGSPGTAIETVRKGVLEPNIIEGYKIETSEDAQGANEQLGKVKGLAKTLEEAEQAERRPLNTKLKEISAKYRDAKDMLEQAEAVLKHAIARFAVDERKRLEDQRRQQALEAERERARLEQEARKTREAASARAEKLEQQGNVERADAVRAVAEQQATAKETVAAMVAAPTKPAEPTKLAGTGIRRVWRAKVDDKRQFLAALAASPYDLDDIVEINAAALNRLAASLKLNMSKTLPGSISWEEDQVSARAQ